MSSGVLRPRDLLLLRYEGQDAVLVREILAFGEDGEAGELGLFEFLPLRAALQERIWVREREDGPLFLLGGEGAE
jgi:hypothetical protein